jgi:hypothetical protein
MLIVGLVAVSAFAVGATSASASATFAFEHYKVRGTLTPKKLNQTITLPTGEFNGEAVVEFVPEPGGGLGVSGPVSGTVTIPPFTATIKLFGLPAAVGLEFVPTGPSQGSITSVAATECGGKIDCEHLSVPTEATINFTAISILGITIPEKCNTITPVKLPLEVNETLQKLLGVEMPAGSFFTGTANFPLVICHGLLGLINGPLLSALFSGPNNPYAISVTPT